MSPPGGGSPVQLAGELGIDVQHLVRDYPSRGDVRRALRGISFTVPFGGVVGLLGPNGAGKTSCVRILATLLRPTAGTASIGGADVVREPRRVQRTCGLSFGGETGLYRRLSGFDNLRFFGTMYGMHGRSLKERADSVLATVGLTDRAADRVETYSRGMKQRLHIARAILHDPKVLLLDEPSSGLDPESARGLRQLVLSLRDEGRAILLTTHDLAEAEQLCDRVLILLNGEIVRSASPQELREQAARSLGVVVEFQTALTLDDSFFTAWPELLSWRGGNGSYRVRCHDAASGAAFVLDQLRGQIGSMQVAPPTLEEAYLEVLQ